MHLAILVYSSAIICVITRGFLNVIDRSVFKKESCDFTQIIFLNAFLPFLVALLLTQALYPQNNIFTFIFDLKIILNALGAQAAATAYSYGFKKMTVRNITASSKMADLFIPILIFFINNSFSLKNYLFSCVSVAIFIPIFLSLNKCRTDFCLKTTAMLWGTLLFQAAINVIFHTYEMVDTFDKFMSFLCCVLFWRVIFILPAVSIKNFRTKNSFYKSGLYMLCGRAFLAFFSQAAFFFSITSISAAVSWPILNSGPLISCVIAHFLINENLKKPEYLTMALFVPMSLLYIIYVWSL